MMNEHLYSIVVPVFNSGKTLVELNSRIHTVMKQHNFNFEIIYVDDGSFDDSWSILEKLKSECPDSLKAIRLARNFGQHNATFCGLDHASGDIIITIDDDLQVPPEEIPKLIGSYHENDADLVYGCFQKKQHSLIRNIGSRLLKKAGAFFNDAPGEGSSFRLFTKDLSVKILSHSQNFVFIDELLLWYTANICFVNVKHNRRKEGKSGYTTIRLLRLLANLIFHYSALPLKIMTYGGLISSVILFFTGLYFFIRWLFFDVPVGNTSIIIAVLFSASVIIFCIGVVGEYINRLYMIHNKKPPYSIRKIL